MRFCPVLSGGGGGVMFLKYPVIYSHAAFQSYKLEENMQLAKEGLEKGIMPWV